MTLPKTPAPSRWSKFAPWIALLVANLASSILLGGRFYVTRSMFWDNCKLYSVFRGNNHALNHFGEVMWWNPAASMGFPAFYFSHLGSDSFTPLSAVILFCSWLLGRLGITITDYTHLYIIYFSFLVPLLFSVALYLLACQIFRSFYLRLFVIIMAAFSPGVVFNYSDNGLEQTAYGVYFAAAFLNFYTTPNRKSFLLLVSASCLAAIAFNHLGLYWNVIFVPLFVLAVVFLRRRGVLAALRRAWQAVPRYAWGGGAVLAGVCLLPAVISFSQGNDILRTRNFERWYAFDYLQAGNPLELLSVSTPGVGFDWISNGEPPGPGGATTDKWGPRGYSEKTAELSFEYMGIMALPLLLVGLCCGRPPWRMRLLLLTAFLALIIMLEGWSSVFASVLVFQSPLRAVNHFNDCTFRVGMFFLVILGAGLGLEAVLIHRRVQRCALPICFACSTVLGLIILLAVHGSNITTQPLAGFFATGTVMFMLLTLGRGRIQRNPARRRLFVIVLLVFIAVDISTVSYWHVRRYMWSAPGGFTDPPVTEMSLPQDDRSFYMQTLLMLRQNYELRSAGVGPAQISLLPRIALFNHVTTMAPADARTLDFGNPGALVVAPDTPGADAYAEFTNATPTESPKARSFEILRQSYDVLAVRITVDQPAILFWRDCNFPGWHATVNGQPVPIVQAFWSFKSVKIPAGESVVRFQYSQPLLLAAFLAGYAIVISTAVLGFVLSAGPRQKAASSKPGRKTPRT